MSYTKQQFVEGAFEEIGLAAYVFDLSAEQLQSGLRRLDTMMGTWNARGIRLGYPIPGSPESSSLTEETGVPDSANEAIISNLAIRLAPAYGKSVQAETRITARQGYEVLLAAAAMPAERQLPATMPAGAGNKSDPFVSEPTSPVTVGGDGPLDL